MANKAADQKPTPGAVRNVGKATKGVRGFEFIEYVDRQQAWLRSDDLWPQR